MLTTLLVPGAVYRAGLIFRAGRADETLSRAGITHLLMHLALAGHGMRDYHFNGTTGAVATHFHLTGPPEDAVAFLNGVCAALADPPVDRMAAQVALLQAEQAGRGHSPADTLARWRYGAQGHGLAGFDELGLPLITAEDLREWSRTWFTADNAVLWIAAPAVPPGLDLRLPPGTRRALPATSPVLPATPAFAPGGPASVAMAAVVPRGAASSLLAGVLERALARDTRPYATRAGTSYEPRDADHATLVATAEARPGQQDALLGAFVDVLAKLRLGQLQPTDLEHVRARALVPMDPGDRLPATALDLLTSAPTHAPDVAAVTLDKLRAVARDAVGTALLLTPPGRDALWAGFTPAAPTRASVAGTPYPRRDDDEQTLIIGRDGVRLPPATVLFTEVAAKLDYPDGGRHLVGLDGVTVPIEPTLYALSHKVLARLDARVPLDRTVPMPARSPDVIPYPSSRPLATATRANRRRMTPDERWVFVASTVLTVLLAACTGVVTFDTKSELAGVGIVITVGAAAALFAWHRKRR